MAKNLIISTLVLCTLASCSKVKKMEDLTQQMADTTSKMSVTTNVMNDTTANMYPQIRTKESEDTRSKKMKIILDDNVAFGEKIAAAAVYYQSFEFQFWTNNGTYDTVEVREKLFLDAMNEFYKRISDIWDNIDPTDISPINTKQTKYNFDMAFYSMSLGMHFINHHQEHIHSTVGGFNKRSFYDLMTNALQKEARGIELTEYEHVALAGVNREISIELLKARYNMIIALAIKSSMESIDDATIGKKAMALLFKLSGGRAGAITLDSKFEQSNESTQKDVLEKLDGAQMTRDVLLSIDEDVELDKNLKSILDNVDTENSDKVENANLRRFMDHVKVLQSL